MHRRTGQRLLLLAVVVGLVCGLWGGGAGVAWATHSEEEHITEDTAYTLRSGEVRLGLWRLEYGLFEDVDVGTWVVPWLLRAPSVSVKWEFWQSGPWSLAARTGLTWLNGERLDAVSDAGATAMFTVVPFELVGSLRVHDDVTVSVGTIFTKMGVDGAYEEEDFVGAAAVTNMQVTNSLEWRLGEVTALVLHSRVLVYQDASGATTFTFAPDAFTTVEVIGAGVSDVVDVAWAASTTLSAVWSWETFNLRAGLGWGNWTLPVVGFVLPEAQLIPDLAMYWRW